LTKGGDVLFSSSEINSGGYQHVYAGNFMQVGAGAMWTSPTLPISVGLSLNYHTDDTTWESAHATFKRWPIEAIGYLLSEDRKWRMGLGARYVTGARLVHSFPNLTIDCKAGYVKFDETLSPVAEVGWGLTKSVWANFRVVKETYKVKDRGCEGTFADYWGFGDKVNGSHIGANILYAF
jgi:hypothetical protein